MTEEVLPQYHHIITSWVLTPGSSGVFDVLVNGELVFSKAQTGRFLGEIELRMILDRIRLD